MHQKGSTVFATRSARQTPTSRGFANLETDSFAKSSHLPEDFFDDVLRLQKRARRLRKAKKEVLEAEGKEEFDSQGNRIEPQMKLLKTIRDLEARLMRAKAELDNYLKPKQTRTSVDHERPDQQASVVLTKDDYMNLVDLYYYSNQNMYSPESPDASPTPLFLDEYSFKLSEDFSRPAFVPDEEENYVSPLRDVELLLKNRQLKEINVMTAFVDLLIDDHSSLVALFDAYKKLPDPGVAYLPTGIVRLFLQRMSTPLQKSEKSMIRYLSLIDDMQRAGLPISASEWSSAIYLAGRSFSRVTEGDMAAAFRVWKQMEEDAGVTSRHVTFNILFDIAVRAGKFALAEAVLKEMHDRGLKLNRLGRVSMIYYHGLRGDGDAVRKTYRDFVEAGEIVDTLVLNCVMASLYNAQEPTAAEQIYERMKNLQGRYQKGARDDGSEGLFLKYPPPGSYQLEHEMASNHLGRVLLKAASLRKTLPDHHSDLQQRMPLTPDHITFRSMISYHAVTSGDIDRLTFLINEMIELFGQPLRTINFQILFKGFALHGGISKHDDAGWTVKRLDLCWEACRALIKESQITNQSLPNNTIDSSSLLPSMKEINATFDLPFQSQSLDQSIKPKKLSAWHEFVLDLAAFPRERRKPIERSYSQDFEEAERTNILSTKTPFTNPFFQQTSTFEPSNPSTSISTTNSSSQSSRSLDHEEGEYTLPLPTNSIHPEPFLNGSETDSDEYPSTTTNDPEPIPPINDPNMPLRINRALLCWLLRAYSRCTGSRTRVEEVYNSARKLWKPLDQTERDSVVRVLKRCLRDCDHYGRPGL